MGDNSDDEYFCANPAHSVEIKAFSMSPTEVTVAEFKKFVDDTGYKTDAEKSDSLGSFAFVNKTWTFARGINWRHDAEGNLRPEKEYDHPVIHVSWNDAVAYCDWLTRTTKAKPAYHLPSEAEWEYAAGNGERHTKYSWGNGSPYGRPTDERDKKVGGNVRDESLRPKLDTSASYFFGGYDDDYAFDAPVAQFAPNDFGLFDMTGNVWEWCEDCWHCGYEGAPDDNRAWTAGECKSRVLRGGSWNDDTYSCRSAFRFNNDTPTYRGNNLGFRLARDGSAGEGR